MPSLFSQLNKFWTGLVSTFLGGAVAVWTCAESMGLLVKYIIYPNDKGVMLSGNYVISTTFLFFAVLVLLALIYVSSALIVASRRTTPVSSELKRVRGQYEDMLTYAASVSSSLYPDPSDRRRVDIVSLSVTYDVKCNGDAKVSYRYKIHCPDRPAHIFFFWLELDDETPGIDGFRPLKFFIKDISASTPLNWIPTTDNKRKKQLSVFYPEMQAGESKEIEIAFECKGYLNRLLEKGVCQFWWHEKSATRGACADITSEWIFESGFQPTGAKLQGSHGAAAELKISKPQGSAFVWTYRSPRAEIEGRDYKITLELDKS